MSERKPIVSVGGELMPLPPSDTFKGQYPDEDKAKLATMTSGAEPNDAIVDLAEAQAGVSITRSGWSALRVRQAVQAWWSALVLDASKVTTGVFHPNRIPTLNQNTTGRAAVATTADRLTTPVTINGTTFTGATSIETGRWGTARTLEFSGDLTGSQSVNGSSNVNIPLTLKDTGVTPGSFPKVTVDSKGRVTAGSGLESSDLPTNAAIQGIWTGRNNIPLTQIDTELATTAFVQQVVAEAVIGGGGGESTAVQIKALYESNPNTNAFTDAEKQKLQDLSDAEPNYVAVTETEAAEGTSVELRSWSPLRVHQAISAWWSTSVFKTKLDTVEEGAQVNDALVSAETAAAGTDELRAGWSALRVRQAIMGWWNNSDEKEKFDTIESGAQVNPEAVGQLEAEEGSSPTVRGWSAMRITQLLIAWWASTYKTKLDGIADGAQVNDTLVTQAIAEAGTSNTRVGWSPLRIRQAIQAWWNGNDDKAKLDSYPAVPPADGKTYALKDGVYTEVSGGGGNLFDIEFYHGLRSQLATERPGFVFLDGGTYLRSLYPEAYARLGSYPIATEANWAAGQKGKFTIGDGVTTFRVPDWNGATGGKARVLRGGVSGTESELQEDALQNITGQLTFMPNAGSAGTGEGAFEVTSNGSRGDGGTTGSGRSNLNFDASRVVRTADETRAASVQGAWIIRLAQAGSNIGTVDVTELASQVDLLMQAFNKGSLIKETYITATGAFTHNFDATCGTYEIEAWSGGAGSGTTTATNGGTTTVGSITITGAVAVITGTGVGGAPGVASGGLLNINGTVAGGTDAASWSSSGAPAPRGGGGGSRVASGPGRDGAQPGGGAGSAFVAGIVFGSSGGYSFDRKPLVPGPSNSISGVVGAGGSAGTNGAKGGDGMVIIREYSRGGPNVDLVAGLYAELDKIPRSYTTAFDYANGGQYTLTHNLGRTPYRVTAWAVAKVAIGGLAIGEACQISPAPEHAGAGTVYGIEARKPTPTTVQLQIATSGLLIGTGSGSLMTVTAAQVSLIVKVEA